MIEQTSVHETFIRFATRALAALRAWAEKEGIKRRTRVGFKFQDDRYEHEIKESTEFSLLIYSHTPELQQLPESDEVVQHLLAAGILKPPTLSDSAGKPILAPTFQQMKPFLFHQVLQPISDAIEKAQSLVLDDGQIVAELEEYLKIWKSEVNQYYTIVPLINFDSEIEFATFGALELRKLTSEDKNSLHSGGFPFLDLSPSDILASKFKLSRMRTEPKSGSAHQLEETQANLMHVITAMRLLKSGNVGALCLVDDQVSTRHSKTTMYSPVSELNVRRFGEIYQLENADLAPLMALHNTLQRASKENRLKPLEVALRRFNQAFSREWLEDKIIDFVIAMESCLLPDQSDELKLRFALRGAALLVNRRDPVTTRALLEGIYDARSQIVHAGKRVSDLKIKTLEKIQIPNHELPTKCEALAREILHEILPEIASGKSAREFTASLETTLMEALKKPSAIN